MISEIQASIPPERHGKTWQQWILSLPIGRFVGRPEVEKKPAQPARPEFGGKKASGK